MAMGYVSAVLKEVFLPRTVKDKIKVQLEEELAGGKKTGETLDETISRLGSPEEVGERYNRNYRNGRRTWHRRINLGILLMLVAIVLAGWKGYDSLYRYVKEQVMWYQYQLYQTMSESTTTVPEGGQSESPFGLEGENPNDTEGAAPFSNEKSQEEFSNSVTLDGLIMVSCTTLIVGCVVGIIYLNKMKKRLLDYKILLIPSMKE